MRISILFFHVIIVAMYFTSCKKERKSNEADIEEPTGHSTVSHLAFLVRNADGSKVFRNTDGTDMYWPISHRNKIDIAFSLPTPQPIYVLRSETQPVSNDGKIAVGLRSNGVGNITI